LTARREKNSARVDLARPRSSPWRDGVGLRRTARKPGFRPERETARMEGMEKGKSIEPARRPRATDTRTAAARERGRSGPDAHERPRDPVSWPSMPSATAAAAPVIEGLLSSDTLRASSSGLGVVLLVCVVTYAISTHLHPGGDPADGYLGGAIATHVRVGNPLFSHTLFPIYVALLIWEGLPARRPLRAIFRARSRLIPSGTNSWKKSFRKTEPPLRSERSRRGTRGHSW